MEETARRHVSDRREPRVGERRHDLRRQHVAPEPVAHEQELVDGDRHYQRTADREGGHEQ